MKEGEGEKTVKKKTRTKRQKGCRNSGKGKEVEARHSKTQNLVERENAEGRYEKSLRKSYGKIQRILGERGGKSGLHLRSERKSRNSTKRCTLTFPGGAKALSQEKRVFKVQRFFCVLWESVGGKLYRRKRRADSIGAQKRKRAALSIRGGT